MRKRLEVENDIFRVGDGSRDVFSRRGLFVLINRRSDDGEDEITHGWKRRKILRAAPRGGGRYRRGAPPPRAAYGPTVMPVPVPMLSPFGLYAVWFRIRHAALAFSGGGFISVVLVGVVVNVVTGFFNSAEQSRYDEYERDEWEREQNQSIDDDDFSDDWRKRR